MAGATSLEDEPLSVGRAPSRRFTTELRTPKLNAPRPRANLVRRSGLISRLEHDQSRALVLLSAPAGYGKSTLLAQWAQDDPRPFAWVTLDDLDGDPNVLADSIACALATIGIRPGLTREFVLVLDDAHRVPANALEPAVLDILAWLPENSQVAVAFRGESQLALDRMRTQRMLVELRAHELSMSAAEAATLLRTSEVELEFTAVQTLVRRTGGWPAALELAAASWTHGPEPLERRGHVSGDDHLISEYFRAELLAGLSPASVRFLTRSSVLDRLAGPVCDEVLGCTDSATVLDELTRANVPLEPVDSSHEWYRLHGLFREMLQTELRRSEPELHPVLHRRAADWYRRAQDVDRAIEHSCRAADVGQTSDLLWTHVVRYLGAGENDRIQRWLSVVSAERIAGNTRLALVAAHSHLALGSVASAEQWARHATALMGEQPGMAAAPERAGALIIEAWAARSGAGGMAEHATRAYDLLRGDDPWRASCCFLRGTAALLVGEDAEAERRLQEGLIRGEAMAPDAAALCLAQLAVLAAERDQMELASDYGDRAGSVVRAHRLEGYRTSALVFAVGADAARRNGRMDEAKQAAALSRELLEHCDDSLSWYGAEVRIVLARVGLALGNVAGARELLAAASRLARRTPDLVIFQRWFDDAWDQFDARAEITLAEVATLTTAELRVLRFLPTHYSFHEIAERLQVSANTVKTHVHAVYRKLDASSRSEAVAHATRAGLLGG